MKQDELIRSIKKGLLKWYPFQSGKRILYIGEKSEPIAEMLFDCDNQVECVNFETISEKRWREEHIEKFSYAVLIEKLELEKDPRQALIFLREVLDSNGRLLMGMGNRYGIRYFCGDRDPYTGRNFDGVENYARSYMKNEDTFFGRMYHKAEMKEMLLEAGWKHTCFYSIMPGLEHPTLLYNESYLPNEDLGNRIFPLYNSPETVFMEEETLYSGLIENDMFHQMANAYLVEATFVDEFSDVNHVTSSMGRGKEDAMLTIIRKSGVVEKRPIYPEGEMRLQTLVQNASDLRKRGIKVVEGKIDNGVYIMPFIEAKVGHLYLKHLLLTDQEKFLETLDHFRDLILKSSNIAKEDIGDGKGALLEKAYIDMVPLNSLYANNEFIFFDQEFCKENYPANVLISRMITTLYSGNLVLEKVIPIEKLLERYNLLKFRDKWIELEVEFLVDLRNEIALREFYKEHRKSVGKIHANRQALNYSIDKYIRLFVDIFHHAETRMLILFGSGEFTKRFLDVHQIDYPVYRIVDNNKEKWGGNLDGIEIVSPDFLKELNVGEYKILICIKNYLSVMNQLDDMGITEYSIYNAYNHYPRKIRTDVNVEYNEKEKKKYHIGYVAGVFDLFHIGHLNLLKKAKEYCEHLIVGVVTDERTELLKGKKPFIPLEERMEIVKGCRYTDQVFMIPDNFAGIRDVYHLYQFDCQFSGNDYEDDPHWQEEKEFLKSQGADLVFFPYTKQTNSTKIKQLIKS